MMRKQFLVILAIALLGLVGNAWAVVTDYTFTSTMGTYTAATGTASLVGSDDAATGALPIGFTFVMGGSSYTDLIATSNGSIGLGTSYTAYNYPTPLSSTSYAGIISFLGGDARSSGGVIVQTTGTAPNRVCTIDYPNFDLYYGSTSDRINVQVRLTETANSVAIVFGSGTAAGSRTPQVGIRGSSVATDFLVRTGTWAASTAGTTSATTMTWNSTTYPANGLTYTFAPPVAGVVPNPAVVTSPLDGVTGVANNAALIWSSGGGGAATDYNVYFGTTLPGTPTANVTSTTWTPPTMAYNTTYYWKVIPHNAVGFATGCPTWSFTTMPDPTITTFPFTYGFENGSVPAPGWTHTIVTGGSGIQATGAIIYPAATPHTGSYLGFYNSYNLSNTYNAWLATPPISCSGGTGYMYTVSFWMYRDTGYPSNADLYNIYTNSTASLTGATLIGTVNRSTTLAPVAPGTGWFQYTFNIGDGTIGTKNIIFHAVSAYGNDMGIDDIQISRVALGSPPNPAVVVAPADGATALPLAQTLTWADGGGFPASYDVYFGTTLPLTPNANVTGTTWTPPALAYNTTYYWKIVPINGNGPATGCPTWSFTTRLDPALTPLNPAVISSPLDAATGVSRFASLNWTPGAGTGSITGYKVYFGTTLPAVPNADITTTTWSPGAMTYNATYLWKIVPYNTAGDAVGCPTWSFTVMPDPTITVLPHTEHFTTWPPAGWTMNTGSSTWTQYNSTWARANYWSQSEGVTDIMITPPIIMAGAGGVQFVWSHQYMSSYPNDALTVQISTDMTTWTDLLSMVGPTFNSGDGAGTTVPGTGVLGNAEIPGTYANNPFYIRFYGYSGWGPDLFIDQVTFYQSIVAPPDPVVMLSPLSGTTGLNPHTVALDWAGSLSGGAADGYGIFISNSETAIFDQYYFEVTAPTSIFNVFTDGGVELTFDTDWYWMIYPFNAQGNPDPSLCPVWSFRTEKQMQVAPTAVGFGTVFTTVPAPTQNVTITNLGLTPFNVTDVSIAGSPEITLQGLPTFPAAVNNGAPFVFTVQLNNAMMGTYSATVTLTNDLGDVVNIPVTASVTDVTGGYFMNNSANATSAPSYPTYGWVDISATGTQVTGFGDDSYTGPIPLGFSFPFFGNTYTDVYFNSNGLITFGAGSTAYSNTTIPTSGVPDNFIALWWNDMTGSNANVPTQWLKYEQIGETFVITYNMWPTLSGAATDWVTCQAILYANGKIKLQYAEIGATMITNSHTIGIEGPTGTTGVQYCANGTGYSAFGPANEPMAVAFSTNPNGLGDFPTPSNVTIGMLGPDVQIGWDAVPTANSYYVYGADDPYGVYTLLAGPIAETNYLHVTADPYKFYKVTASTDSVILGRPHTVVPQSRPRVVTDIYDKK